MTVDRLIEMLRGLSNEGHGDEEVVIWDPDSEAWEGVTCAVYGGGGLRSVQLYSDED